MSGSANVWRMQQSLRIVRLAFHLLQGLLVVALVYPFVSDGRRLWLKQRWSFKLLRILGVRLDARLSGLAPGSLIVANHVSWLDIYALNAARPSAFVAKDEVRKWPLIGWLAAHTDTLFLRRGSRRHARTINSQVSALLSADKDVVVFPEGTTTDGSRLLDFHAALLQPAIDCGRPVQPVALSYHDACGRRSTRPAYAGDTTLGDSLMAIVSCPGLTVRLRPTPVLDRAEASRRQLAIAAQGAIAFSLGVGSGQSLPEFPERVEASPAVHGDELPDPAGR